jgi:deoxyribose-phosphate aldolase
MKDKQMLEENIISNTISVVKNKTFVNKDSAKRAISVLDFTSLNDNDTENVIKSLCLRSQTIIGNTAAICINPVFIKFAREILLHTNIKIATVVNFPDGGINITNIKKEIIYAISQGADEIDIVFPYRDFIEGNIEITKNIIKISRGVCGPNKTLKVILESGMFKDFTKLYEATLIAIEHGADFIKTSTGKVDIGATPESCLIILKAISDAREKYNLHTGFKISGGVKTAWDAAFYLTLVDEFMGKRWISPQTFRFGASGILTKLLEIHNIKDNISLDSQINTNY